MQCFFRIDYSAAGCRALLLPVLLLLSVLAPGPAWAQHNCLLVPVPLTERLSRATWVIEARADAPQVQADARGHLLTRYGLTLFKVFRGPAAALPTRLLLPGGTLGDRREEVSSTPALPAGQQGVFFLEPDPQHPGEWRLFAGPQGLIAYDLARHTATEPFAEYPVIETSLYAALRDAGQPLGYRTVQANAALTAPQPGRRPAGTAAVIGAITFSPTTITAGTGAVLTITGSGFGESRGTGSVQFRNANSANAGSRVRPLDSDYLSWTDTEIRVRVPSTTLEGPAAGSGPVLVLSGAGETGTSAPTLTINYAVTNLSLSGEPRRSKLTDDNGAGGYTLAYAPSLQANAAARAAFERANTQWTCLTGTNRTTTTTPLSTVPTPPVTADGTNIVTFDDPGAPTLSAGVLGVTYTYFRLCQTEVTVPEMDFVFANRADYNYASAAPAPNQFDFESVALHELGHGVQLNHVINPAAVMHFTIGNGQTKRTLGADDDQAGGRDVVAFSATPNTPACGTPPAPHRLLTLPGCTPLPVELTAFTARYEAGRGTELRWATATERNSAYFALEAREEGIPAWAELRRLPAAGLSSAPRHYQARDPRLLSGTRYYRLRQVDEDGQTSFSPVVAVAATEASLALYPNPATDWLEVSGPPVRAGQLRFYDLTAREAARFELAPGAGNVDISQLRPGLYLVEWTDGQTVRRGRLQKR